ncbi:hypothetical protein AO392_14395 [Pseudomonas putida]|uniref:BRO-N domain-containing protein n=1 Tax=Pseudomonas putida TaxID=303 RepID=UPI00072FE927|nr:Bro-N domain-containing protein [Pseudomonas putida]KTC25413.1 hypothetical protein AO392_14395 [Pseudomonas putida]
MKTKKPQCGNTEASGNEINFEEEIVMSDNSTNVVPFNFGKQQVRTLLVEGEPWFSVQDLLGSLEYTDSYKPARATAHVPEQWKGVHRLHTPGGSQRALMLSEQGLYFFLGRSDKKKAIPFQMWIAGEVLPEIRRTGRYEDQQAKMPTLLDELIGMSELGVIKGLIRDKGKAVAADKRQSFALTMHSRLHTRFNVPRTELIPAGQFDTACNFIAAYALEGEYIEALPKDGVTLDQYETHHLYLLMSRFAAMFKHKNDMLAASRALESTPLMGIFEQLKDGDRSFEVLDRRRGEIYGAYSATGCQGGYAWRAAA